SPYKGFKVYEQPAPADDEADAATPAPAAPAQTVVAPPPTKPVPKPAPKPVAVAAPTPKPVAKADMPATAPPAELGAPIPKAAPAPKPAPVKTVAALASGGSYVLQIGAYKSQADADTAWRTYKAKHAALLSGYDQDVQQADLGEKGTWYRLRIAGFASKDVASAMCDRLKADGGNCFLGK
ncbi:MAG TPA: SPOR domain-containing protein, partial [Rhizomicrobium sp.]